LRRKPVSNATKPTPTFRI